MEYHNHPKVSCSKKIVLVRSQPKSVGENLLCLSILSTDTHTQQHVSQSTMMYLFVFNVCQGIWGELLTLNEAVPVLLITSEWVE